MPEPARELLSRTEFTRGRHNGRVSIVFPGVAEFRVPISESGSLMVDFWPERTWLTIIEPTRRSADFYDVDIVTGEKSPIVRINSIDIPVDEELVATRDRTGSNLIVAGSRVGVIRVDTSSGAIQRIVAAPSGDTDRRGERKFLYWSPSGESLASPLCDEETCSTEVIATDDWSYVTVAPFAPTAITDQFVLGGATLDTQGWLLVDLATGEPTPVLFGHQEGWSARPTTEGRFIANGGVVNELGERQQLFELDPQTLESRPIYDASAEDGRSYMHPAWTSPDWVLLLGPETNQLIVVDANTGAVYDGTLHTTDQPEG